MGADLEEVEEADEEGQWEWKERTTTKGRLTNRGNDDYDSYASTHLESEVAAAATDSEAEILFAFKGKDSVATAFGYTDIVVAVLVPVYLLVLVHWLRYRKRGDEIVPGRKRLTGRRFQASEEE